MFNTSFPAVVREVIILCYGLIVKKIRRFFVKNVCFYHKLSVCICQMADNGR